jgi:hypothetical protein
LKVIGKGITTMTQAVAVAAPISLQPIYPQNVILAPVYTQPMVYGNAAGVYQQPGYAQQPTYANTAGVQQQPQAAESTVSGRPWVRGALSARHRSRPRTQMHARGCWTTPKSSVRRARVVT